MTRFLPALFVLVAACSSQSQTAPGPAEAQTVATAPDARMEVTPPESVAASFPKAKKEAQEHATQLVEQGRAVLKTKGRAGAAEAATLFTDATKEDPRNAIAYWELGWAQQIGGNVDAALATWQTLKQLDPKFPDLDSFSTIADARRNEPQAQAPAPAQPDGEPTLATTPPTKKKPKKGNVANGTSASPVPKIPPQ